MSRHRIAGLPVDRGGTRTTDQGKLWFSRLIPGDVMVPVRMEFGSEFGTSPPISPNCAGAASTCGSRSEAEPLERVG
jgi:hypothetical protein